MAEIVNLFTNETSQSEELKNPQSVALLHNFYKNADNFTDIVIFFKKSDGTVGIFETDISIEDKALMHQLVQHQITAYLDRRRVPVDNNLLEDDI